MRKSKIYALLLITTFLLSGCNGRKSSYHIVKHHKPRQSSFGFSIKPPPGQNWYEQLKNDSLFYLKVSSTTAHSYSILTEAKEVQFKRNFKNPAAFKNYVKASKNEPLANNSFRNKSVTAYIIEQSGYDYCVRYQLQYEDHGMKALKGKRHVDVTTTGLFCRHPSNPLVGIDISYLEKTLSGMRTKSYKREGEMFLSSLSFTPAS